MLHNLLTLAETNAGIYTLQEAAFYAKIPVSTLRYWFLGNKVYSPLRTPFRDTAGYPYLTFRDFLEAVAIRELRNKVQLPKIRDAIVATYNNYGIEYPFSNKHHHVEVSGNQIHIYINKKGAPVQISGRAKFQQSFTHQLTAALSFNQNDEAIEYNAGTYDGKKVVLNPGVLFGQPRVFDSPCSASVLWRAVNEEGSFENAAKIFQVDVSAVIASFNYCEDVRLAA